METVFDVIQSLQLSFSQVLVVAVLIFVAGYAVGTLRVRKLLRERDGLESTVMALNEELLYGTPSVTESSVAESNTPVIGLKPKRYSPAPIAK